MKKIIIVVFIIFVIMFQVGILSQIRLQAGKLDLILLVITALVLIKRVTFSDSMLIGLSAAAIIGLISAEPFVFVLIVYMSAALFGYYVRTRVWKMPIITMFFIVGVISVLHHLIFGTYLIFDGANFNFSELFQKVLMPSLMLNIMAVVPVYFLVLEVWQWFSPIEEEE